MAEKLKFAPLEAARKKVEQFFSIDDLSIDLEGFPEAQKLTELLERIETIAFDENGTITEDGKDDTFSDLVTGICLESLNQVSKLTDILGRNKRKEALAILSGNDAETENIPGMKDGVDSKKASEVLDTLRNLIYAYLNQYAEQGYLSIDDMKKIGFSDRDVEAVEKNITEKLEKEIEEWKNGEAEKQFPSLANLKTETEKEIVTAQEADDQITVIDELMGDIQKKLEQAMISGEKYQFVEKEFFSKAKARILELHKIKEKLEKEEAETEIKEKANTEIAEFKEKLEDFIKAIDSIPFSRKEITTIEEDGSIIAHDPDDKDNGRRFIQEEAELKRRKALLIKEQQKVEALGLLKEKDSSDTIAFSEINGVIRDVLRKSSEAEKRINNLIKEAIEPPVEEMGLNALVEELIKNNHDPYFFKEQKSGVVANQRAKDLAEAFKQYYDPMPELGPEGELNRVVQVVRVQLNFLSSQLQHEPGLPSRERTALWKEAIQRQLKRRELLTATTYHPEWGSDIRDMLEWSFRVAALRRGQILVKRKREKGLRAGEYVLVGAYQEGKAPSASAKPKDTDNVLVRRKKDDGSFEDIEIQWGDRQEGDRLMSDKIKNLEIRSTDLVLVRRKKDDGSFEDIEIQWGDRQEGDEPLEAYRQNMDYGVLTKENGEFNMIKEIEDRFPNVDPQALKFAMQLFGCFDLLTISLGELQKNTKTRGHNADVKDKDRIMFADPLAAAMHRAFRYWNEHEWSLRTLLFLEDINNGDARYGIHDDREEMKNHEWLANLQKLLLMHQEVFFDTSSFAGKVPLPEFCEATGINPYDFLTLHSTEEFSMGDEILELPDGRIAIHDGRIIGKENRDGEEVWVDQNGNEVDMKAERLLNKDGSVKGENIAVTKWYELAEENGFTQLLELTFKRMPVLSDDDIFRKHSDGSKGGVLSNWLQTAGRAKMFPGSHMKNYFEPLLANFVLRIFQQYKGRYNRDLRESMFHEMVDALESSALDPAGLNAYKVEVANVINAICEKPLWDITVDPDTGEKKATRNSNKPIEGDVVKPWDDRRDEQKKQYLIAWFVHKFHRQPPIELLGLNLDAVARPFKKLRQKIITGQNPDEVEFMEIINGKKAIPDLVERTGDLMKKEDK